MTTSKEPTRYDVVAYSSHALVQTHPNRLAVAGTLFGLEPAPVTGCRVLELGCGDGSNLAPMAFGLPGSEFVGIDLAAKPIAQARQMASELGLKNLQFLHGSVTEFDEGQGKFDYIIAHGLFSWVPAEVREHILALCRRCLAPRGIAFISYNALPGCHLRAMIREMMLYHVRGIHEPERMVHQAGALVQFLAEAREDKDPYGRWLKSELETVRRHPPGQLFHDELAEFNQPYYFSQFVQQATQHGLKYLAEANYFEMSDHQFNDTTRTVLAELGADRIRREQYLDFLKCRRFRQTLLCHAEAPTAAEAASGQVTRFFINSMARRGDGPYSLEPSQVVNYVMPYGGGTATNFALGKAALEILGEDELRYLAFDDLFARAAAKLADAGIALETGEPREKLAAFLLQLHGAAMVDFRIWQPALVLNVSERPTVTALTRWQIQRSHCVTSQFHTPVHIEDESGRTVLSWLDGTLDQAALREKTLALLRANNALGEAGDDEAAARRKVEANLSKKLGMLARLALLVA